MNTIIYGTEQGDALLCHIADMARSNFARNACTARIYAGHFVTLDEAEDLSVIIDKVKSIGNTLSSPQPNITVMLIFGIYPVVDRSIPAANHGRACGNCQIERERIFGELFCRLR